MVTSKRGEERLVMGASSFAVWKASRTVAKPVSKTPSRARTKIFMVARIVSNLAFLPIGKIGVRELFFCGHEGFARMRGRMWNGAVEILRRTVGDTNLTWIVAVSVNSSN